jgi:RimJ/RimL family protein N-acetyltransferase
MNTGKHIFESQENSEKIFPPVIKIPVENFLTGQIYDICGGDSMTFSDDDIKKIVEICSQPDVHKRFTKRLSGQPYTDMDALNFIEYVKTGWAKGLHFVFFVRDSNSEIVAEIEIRNPDLNRAEIGYWSDMNHRGLMTNTIKEIVNISRNYGFRKLFAGVSADNDKSIAVLKRAGFEQVAEDMKDDKPHFIYEMSL